MSEAPKTTVAPNRKSAVTLRVEYPNNVFDPSIKGVDPITDQGTVVDPEHVDDIVNSAMVYGVSVVVTD